MRIFICAILVCWCLASVALAGEQTQTQLVPSPDVQNIMGITALSLGASRWPVMSAPNSDNPGCVAGISQRCKANCDAFSTTDLKKEYSIPADYRKTAKIVVSWVLRVVGASDSCPDPWPNFCSPFHGTYTCTYPSGEVRSQLFVNGKAVGQQAVMTVPGTDSQGGSNISDPTNTGSAVIDPSVFGGAFPATITIEIRWRNDTTMQVTSAVNQHYMEIMFLPLVMQNQ